MWSCSPDNVIRHVAVRGGMDDDAQLSELGQFADTRKKLAELYAETDQCFKDIHRYSCWKTSSDNIGIAFK